MTVDIAKLRELLAAGTPGPWLVVRGDFDNGDRYVFGIDAPNTVDDFGSGPETVRNRIVETDCGVYPPRLPDAALICAAVNALPELLAIVEASIEMRVVESTPVPGESLGELHANVPEAQRRTQLALTKWRNAVDAARKAGT